MRAGLVVGKRRGVNVHCWVYRSAKKEQTYLYVPRENAFEGVPRALLRALGELELVMQLELHAGRKLARAEVEHVMAQLEAPGYYLQMPPSHPEQA